MIAALIEPIEPASVRNVAVSESDSSVRRQESGEKIESDNR
jgi:hypothetical protein